MKGIEWNEFVEHAYFGSDAFMRFHDKIYQIGGYYDNIYCIYVEQWSAKYEYIAEILKLTSESNKDIWIQFLEAKIFDGKTIEEAGDDVKFLEWG